MKTIRDFELKEKKVIIRCDFNVPIKDGVITDDNRIIESLETIIYAIERKAKVILMSHLGRVASEEDKSKNTLLPVAKRLEALLKKKVIFISDSNGNSEIIAKMKPGQIVLLENTRHQDYPVVLESNNNQELANRWASLGDIFINDAFGSSHRAHASTVGIAKILPAGIGFLVERELLALKKLEDPEYPLIIILGGAKVADKIPLIKNLIQRANYILTGGGIANTFIKAQGISVGNSLVDEESLDFCQEILGNFSSKIILPSDFKVAKSIEDEAVFICDKDKIPEEHSCFDIGPKTIEIYKSYLNEVKTVVWNGTMGVAENRFFQAGTFQLAKALTEIDGMVVIAGGDTVAAIMELGFKDNYSHVSTGGGATIEMLEGRELPGIKVIAECE